MSEELKERIKKEMVADYGNALERNFETALKFIRITPDGKVDIINRNGLTGEELIELYLIGKIYAKKAGLSNSEETTNKELMEELGVPMGSVLPWTKNLRDGRKITSTKPGVHIIPPNLIEKTLKEIQEKIFSEEDEKNG